MREKSQAILIWVRKVYENTKTTTNTHTHAQGIQELRVYLLVSVLCVVFLADKYDT